MGPFLPVGKPNNMPTASRLLLILLLNPPLQIPHFCCLALTLFVVSNCPASSTGKKSFFRSSLAELKGSWNYFSHRLRLLAWIQLSSWSATQVVLKYETLSPFPKKQESAFGVSLKGSLMHGQQTWKRPRLAGGMADPATRDDITALKAHGHHVTSLTLYAVYQSKGSIKFYQPSKFLHCPLVFFARSLKKI